MAGKQEQWPEHIGGANSGSHPGITREGWEGGLGCWSRVDPSPTTRTNDKHKSCFPLNNIYNSGSRYFCQDSSFSHFYRSTHTTKSTIFHCKNLWSYFHIQDEKKKYDRESKKREIKKWSLLATWRTSTVKWTDKTDWMVRTAGGGHCQTVAVEVDILMYQPVLSVSSLFFIIIYNFTNFKTVC